MKSGISFYLNGKPIHIENPPPDLLLVDYLRSEAVGLTGAKKSCGQGGCGACTVILSKLEEDGQVHHRSINSCLRPVCTLDGLAITTVEGTGAAERPVSRLVKNQRVFAFSAAPFEAAQEAQRAQEQEDQAGPQLSKDVVAKSGVSGSEMNPVAYYLAANNGTQCGYCTTGFVMNMSAFLAGRQRKPTKREIEEIFDGNICRCTGYRPILTGMKTFASNWTKEDEEHRMKCLVDDASGAKPASRRVKLALPDTTDLRAKPVTAVGEHQLWFSPESVDALRALCLEYKSRNIRLILGNTSFGIYADEVYKAEVLIDINLISELYRLSKNAGTLSLGAATSYSQLLEALSDIPPGDSGPLVPVYYMARRTAGMIVRNAASIGGNTMLVLQHIRDVNNGCYSPPFPSDLFTALAAVEAKIDVLMIASGEEHTLTVAELIERARQDAGFADDILLLCYHLPIEPKGIFFAQKVALREVNSHSIVNWTSVFVLDDNLTVQNVRLVIGGIAPYPWRPVDTEAQIRGRTLTLDGFSEVSKTLRKEVTQELKRWAPRMHALPDEGFTDEYRTQLCTGFLYKALINALLKKDAKSVPAPIRSAGVDPWGKWPVSDGRQFYKSQAFKKPVSEPYIKIMAMRQASGQVHYTHEIQVPPLGVNAAFVQSRRALAIYFFRIPDEGKADKGRRVGISQLKQFLLQRFEHFVDLVTYKDIPPGGKNLQGMGADQPLLAIDRISYVGQAIALVIADSEQHAISIAGYVSDNCVGYDTKNPWGDHKYPPEWNDPILGIDRALEIGSIFPDCPVRAPFVSHIWKITRHGSRFGWANGAKPPLDKHIVVRHGKVDNTPCTIIESTQQTGGQIHFYMETQACVAVPKDNDVLAVHPSSQSPAAMHDTVASAIGSEHNHVNITICQLGGGYGGKTEQARFVAGPAAIAAKALKRPVRLVMPRDDDTSMIGKRHGYYGQYQIAVDSGELNSDDRGIIHGFRTRMWGDGGAFYDCSFVVANCIQTRADNAYLVRNFENQIDVCRTNTAPNTAFRSFGDLQATIIQENAIDDAAFSVGMCPAELREKNLYRRGDVTPFGQALTFCYIREVWQFLKQKSDFEKKKASVEKFNRDNRWRKRGVYMVPVKYGSGYNLSLLEQATAVISIYHVDGTLVIHQGGVDMGQGMMTKIEQIASYILNVPMDMVRVESVNTGVIPNPTSTGGSTGTAYNGEAVKRVCQVMRSRLMDFGYQMLKERGNEDCVKLGIDFWNYPEGWLAKAKVPGLKENALIWQNLVSLAYERRVGLVASFNAPIAGGEKNMPVTTYKPWEDQQAIPGIELPTDKSTPVGGTVDEFVGFTYSAACSMVEVDILTGEVKILSSDVVYDMGWSINPALDIGQVEGAFVQGIGYMLTEELVFQSDGPAKGTLNTVNTWGYKPPATTTIPLEMNVYLFPRDKAGVPENPNELMSAKEVGEPPMVLSSSVFFAVKAAVRASRVERGLDGLFRMDAPATVQEVRRACAVGF